MSFLKLGIDHSSVISILQKRFGPHAFISTSFIQRVKKSTEGMPQVDTLAVDPDGTLWWNEEFFYKHVNTPRKLEEALFHELLHHVLGDFTRSKEYLANFFADIVINSIVGRTLGHCDLMQSFYKGQVLPIEGMLRPGSTIRADAKKFQAMYNLIWGFWNPNNQAKTYQSTANADMNGDFNSIQELLDIGRIMLTRYQSARPQLIGGHGHEGEQSVGQGGSGTERTDAGFDEEMSSEARARVGEEIADYLEQNCTSAGYGDKVFEMVIKTIRANATLISRMLEEFAIDNELSSIKRYFNVRIQKRAVYPRNGISRRDAALLGAGVMPVFWQTDRIRQRQQKRGVAIYVDVSGSVYGELPRVCGLIHAMRRDVDQVYEFSNIVLKTSTRELGAGIIKTSGGTDYDCIVEHAVQAGHKKIIVITDGYAGLREDNKALALANISNALVVYVKQHTKDEFWNQHYHKSMPLDRLFR